MQKKVVVSKAEAAIRWGVGRSTVSSYCKRGMPQLEDGRLDWTAADAWRRDWIVTGKSCNPTVRRRATLPGGESGAQATDTASDAFRSGYGCGVVAIRSSLRRVLPALLGEMPAEGAQDRLAVFALADTLAECWHRDPANRADEMLPIDFNAFEPAIAQKKARAVFDEIRRQVLDAGE